MNTIMTLGNTSIPNCVGACYLVVSCYWNIKTPTASVKLLIYELKKPNTKMASN